MIQKKVELPTKLEDIKFDFFKLTHKDVEEIEKKRHQFMNKLALAKKDIESHPDDDNNPDIDLMEKMMIEEFFQHLLAKLLETGSRDR